MVRTKTLNVNGDIIKITATSKSYMNNISGYKLVVNDKEYYCNLLGVNEAIEYGYVKYIKENR